MKLKIFHLSWEKCLLLSLQKKGSTLRSACQSTDWEQTLLLPCEEEGSWLSPDTTFLEPFLPFSISREINLISSLKPWNFSKQANSYLPVKSKQGSAWRLLKSGVHKVRSVLLTCMVNSSPTTPLGSLPTTQGLINSWFPLSNLLSFINSSAVLPGDGRAVTWCYSSSNYKLLLHVLMSI